MNYQSDLRTILVAEDDPDDQDLIREAFGIVCETLRLSFVNDGEELMEILQQKGREMNPPELYPPAIILLDLNMPKLDGREVLKLVKSDPELQQIPVVVFSTSTDSDDVLASYRLGANSYIEKPSTFHSLLELIKDLSTYWLEDVRLPETKQ